MTIIRVDDDTLSLHLEVALSTAPPALLDSLAATDRRRRYAAIGEIARQLAERLRCFDIQNEDAGGKYRVCQSPLFAEDLRPMDSTPDYPQVDKLDN